MPNCPSCGEENPNRARFCSACGTELAGETTRSSRKTVTVLFTDLEGSTSLGDRMDPEALQRVIGQYFETAREVVERHGGTVEKFIGDAVVAVFGVPVAREDDALRAVRTAVDLREALKALNKELERDFDVTIHTRTGINTGEILAGEQAAGQSLMNADCVNVAARIEQAAGRDETFIGRSTHALVRDAVVAERLAPLALKGKPEGVEAWRLVDVVPLAMGVARRMDAPLVGRTRELALLRQAHDRAVEERRCHLFTILGPAGVGKSRLAKEFVDTAGATVLHGRCLSYGEGITFWPLAEIVREAAGIGPADTPAEALGKIAAVLGDDASRASHSVAAMVGLGPPTPAPEEEFWAARTLLERCATESPLVVVVDDVHWAEPPFMDFLDHVADWSRTAPLLLLCIARPELLEHRPGWGGGKVNAASILLEPLSDEDADRLIEDRIALPAEARRKILRVAGGNPLFVEETISMLVDEGAIRIGSDGASLAGNLDRIAMPPTIDVLLTARLDRLNPDERSVLEGAAVIGEQFGLEEVGALSSAGTHLLQALMRKELIRPDGGGLCFAHALVREATYNLISKARRAELHERFADWLEHSVGERLSEYQELLGHHLGEAVRYRHEIGEPTASALPDRACRHLVDAGMRAFARADASAAAALLRKALDLDESARRSATFLTLGAALMATGDLPDAEQALEEAARRSITSLESARARLALIGLRLTTDPRSRTLESIHGEIEQMIVVFSNAGDEESLCNAWVNISHAYNLVGNTLDRHAALEKAAQHARNAGGSLYERTVLPLLLHVLAVLGHKRAIDQLTEEAIRPDIPARTRIGALRGLAYREFTSGSIERGRRLFQEARTICETMGLGLDLALVTMWLGFSELDAGDPAITEKVVRPAYEYLGARGEQSYRSTMGTILAMSLNEQGRHAEALALAREALALGSDEDFATVCSGKSAEATALGALGEVAEAERLAREAVELASKSTEYSWMPEALIALGDVLRYAGRIDEARESFERGAQIWETWGSVNCAARLRRRIAALTS